MICPKGDSTIRTVPMKFGSVARAFRLRLAPLGRGEFSGAARVLCSASLLPEEEAVTLFLCEWLHDLPACDAQQLVAYREERTDAPPRFAQWQQHQLGPTRTNDRCTVERVIALRRINRQRG